MIALETLMGARARGISVDLTKEYSPTPVRMVCISQDLIVFGMLNYTSSSSRISMRMTYDPKKVSPPISISLF